MDSHAIKLYYRLVTSHDVLFIYLSWSIMNVEQQLSISLNLGRSALFCNPEFMMCLMRGIIIIRQRTILLWNIVECKRVNIHTARKLHDFNIKI